MKNESAEQSGKHKPAVIAISIRQPYLELILLGVKTREYRSRPTIFRGTVLLYAPKTLSSNAVAWNTVVDLSDEDAPELPVSVILGTIDIVDCIENGDDGYAYHLENPVRFASPRKATGKPQPCFWMNR